MNNTTASTPRKTDDSSCPDQTKRDEFESIHDCDLTISEMLREIMVDVWNIAITKKFAIGTVHVPDVDYAELNGDSMPELFMPAELDGRPTFYLLGMYDAQSALNELNKIVDKKPPKRLMAFRDELVDAINKSHGVSVIAIAYLDDEVIF